MGLIVRECVFIERDIYVDIGYMVDVFQIMMRHENIYYCPIHVRNNGTRLCYEATHDELKTNIV